MTRVALALLGAVAVAGAAGAAACKKPAPPAPLAADYDVALDARDDCLHHAAALAPLAQDAVLVFGACGHTGEDGAGEEIVGVRIDARGVAGMPEPIQLLEAGWATNVVAAPVAGGGALVGWTAAVARRASVYVAPVDVLGRPAGEPVAIGDGRAAALAPGPNGAALALVTDSESLSDADPTSGVQLALVVLDAGGQVVAREPLSRRVEASRPQVALAGDARGYVIVWSEAGVLTAARTDAGGHVTVRGAIAPEPGVLALPPGTRLAWPAVILSGADADAVRVAVLVERPDGTPAEIWIGDGKVGMSERDWRWRRAVGSGEARAPGAGEDGTRARLALARGTDGSAVLAWTEGQRGQEFPELRIVRVDARGEAIGAPAVAVERVVVFDGAVAASAIGNAAVVAAAQPPAGERAGALRVVQRVAPR